MISIYCIFITITLTFTAISIIDSGHTFGISPYCAALAPDIVKFLINATESQNVILSFENETGFPETCHEYILYDQNSQNLYFFGADLNSNGFKHLNDLESLSLIDTIDDTDIRNVTQIQDPIPPDASISTLILLENGSSHEVIWSTHANNTLNSKILENVSVIVNKMKEICECTEPKTK